MWAEGVYNPDGIPGCQTIPPACLTLVYSYLGTSLFCLYQFFSESQSKKKTHPKGHVFLHLLQLESSLVLLSDWTKNTNSLFLTFDHMTDRSSQHRLSLFYPGLASTLSHNSERFPQPWKLPTLHPPPSSLSKPNPFQSRAQFSSRPHLCDKRTENTDVILDSGITPQRAPTRHTEKGSRATTQKESYEPTS